MSKSAPKAPDYEAAAQAQADSSAEVTNMQTWANRPNQNTPFGSQSWDSSATVDPATGQPVTQWTQNTTLTPESQRALDAQLGLTADRSELGASLMPRAEQEFGNAMNWDNLQEIGKNVNPEAVQRGLSTDGMQGVSSADKYYGDAENAIYGKFKGRADERFAQDEEAMRSRLYAQGLREGDEAFDREVKGFDERKNDAYEQGAYGATIGAGAEAQRYLGMDSSVRGQQFGERSAQGAFANQAANQVFGQNMDASRYDTQLRQQQLTEEMTKRGFSLNEINAILSGQQVNMPGMPNFTPATKSEGVQSLAAAQMTGQSALDAFNAQQSGLNSAMGGVAQLGSTAMMFSDRRLKKNIVELGVDEKGLMKYEFHYQWDRDTDKKHTGYMADEVEKLYPHAVLHLGEYKMVNYGSL